MAPSIVRTLSHHLFSAAGTATRAITRTKPTTNQEADDEDFITVNEPHSEDDSPLLETPVMVTPEEAEALARQELDDEYAKVVAIAAARGSNQSTFSKVKEVLGKTAQHISRRLHPPKAPTPEEAQCPCLNPDEFYACWIQEHVSAGFKRLREKNKAMR